jgi:peptide chain release factor subunit 1
LKGIIIGGPGPLKEKFYEGEFLNYQLQKKVLGVVDTSYLGQQGLEEAVERGQELIKEAALVKERQLLQNFFLHLQKEDGLAVYKIDEVARAIEAGAVEILLISEAFDWKKYKLSCQCGFKTEKAGRREDVFKCPNCGSVLAVQEQEDLADMLAEKVKEMGGSVEIISKDSREGSALKEIGGIGAILRYRLS